MHIPRPLTQHPKLSHCFIPREILLQERQWVVTQSIDAVTRARVMGVRQNRSDSIFGKFWGDRIYACTARV